MIVKGAARAGPTQLGNYLMRLYASADKNEYTELLELQSPWATPETPSRERAAAQLVRTFGDWQTLAEGTKQGRDGLYHAQISPAATYAMTTEQWIRAADILGEELGLKDQQRMVVLHGGEDRPHIHVVWARTDIDTMKLCPDSHNYLAHERASQRMELEFGHEFVPGKHAKRDREKQPEFPRAEMTTAECQQAERTGIDPARRKEQITALKQASDSARAFKAGLEEQGYILARGKRGFVLVDEAGEIYSLSRQIRGITAAELREFMKGIDLQTLPTVEQAREALKQPAPESPAVEQPQPPEQTKSLSTDEIQAIQKAVAERQAREVADMRQRHDAEFQHTRDILDEEIVEKLGHFDARQEAERARFERDKARAAGLDRVIDTIQRWWNPKQVQKREAARERHENEMKERQQTERDQYKGMLEQTRDIELDNLAERHAQQHRDHAQRTKDDLDRYLREKETARKLRVELEERQRELDEERTRDGPEWPPPRAR
jgi:hypothetical protein